MTNHNPTKGFHTNPEWINKKPWKPKVYKGVNYSQENIDKQAEHALWQTKLYNEPLHDLNESVQRNEPEQMRIK